MPRGRYNVIRRQTRKMVYSVIQFMKKENEDGVQIPLKQIQKRAVAATGVSLRTVQRIAATANESGMLPGKKRRGVKRVTGIDGFDQGVIKTKDTFNESVSTIIERKVRGWLSGVIEDMRRSSSVQQWLDSLPTEPTSEPENSQLIPTEGTLIKTTETKSDDSKADETLTENTVIEPIKEKNTEEKNLDVPIVPKDVWKRKSLDSGLLTSTPQKGNVRRLHRDHSLQSDASGSSGSSVLNVLGARKVDAESVLLALGFGPSEKLQKLQRIPDRFLVPSRSDASGPSGSSVLNVLRAWKVDAESVLLALGFGPSEKQQKLQRIPDRFLVPSRVTMIPAVACKTVACIDPWVYAISHPIYRQELQRRMPWLQIHEPDDTASTGTGNTVTSAPAATA